MHQVKVIFAPGRNCSSLKSQNGWLKNPNWSYLLSTALNHFRLINNKPNSTSSFKNTNLINLFFLCVSLAVGFALCWQGTLYCIRYTSVVYSSIQNLNPTWKICRQKALDWKEKYLNFCQSQIWPSSHVILAVLTSVIGLQARHLHRRTIWCETGRGRTICFESGGGRNIWSADCT